MHKNFIRGGTHVAPHGTLFNVCNGEFVNFTGTIELLVHHSESSAGAATVKTQQKTKGSGIGLASGHPYRVFSIADSEMNGPKPGAGAELTETTTNNNDLNGPAQDDHFIFQFKTHMVLKSTGPAVLVDDLKTCCPGSQDDTLTCQPVSPF